VIEIANARDLGPPSEWPEWYVYVGRAAPRKGLKASRLANPHRVGRHCFVPELRNGARYLREVEKASRDEVLAAYRGDLELAVSGYKTDGAIPGMRIELARLRALHEKHGKLTLVCWCAPKPCHGDVIKAVLEAAT